MRIYAVVAVLMTLVVAPAEAQMPVGFDPETMKIAAEMELTRLVLFGLFVVILVFLGIVWRINISARDNTAAVQRQSASDALARSAELDAGRKEREGFLGLVWAMQGTIVQTKEAMIGLNAGYAAQTKATEAHTEALTAHTAEAKIFRAELEKEFKALKSVVVDGHDKMGDVVRSGITEGLKAAAEILAEHNRATMGALTNQITLLNERLAPQIKGEGHEAAPIEHPPANATAGIARAGAGDGHAGIAADARA